MPRRAVVDGGRPRVGHAAVVDDGRVRAALVGVQPVDGGEGPGLLLALDEDPDVDGQVARAGELAGGVQQWPEVALVVRGAAGEHPAVADLRGERRRGPERRIADALDVVVAVDEHGRGVRAGGSQVADDERRAAVEAHEVGRAAGVADLRGGPLRGPVEVGGVPFARRDRGDPQPVDEVVQEGVGHGRQARAGPPGGRAETRPPVSAGPSLYRRHRPRTFADVVGQEHVVRTLRNAIEQGKVHHAYLFVGSRGTGKTSMAKILAACLNCVNGPTTDAVRRLRVVRGHRQRDLARRHRDGRGVQQLGRRHPRAARAASRSRR